MLVPDLEHDHLTLFSREAGQLSHRKFLAFSRIGSRLEPVFTVVFALDSAQQAAAVVQRPVSDRAKDVAGLMIRGCLALQQRSKGLLQDILSLAVGQSQRSGVQHQRGPTLFIESLTPFLVPSLTHVSTSMDTGGRGFV